MKKRILYTFGNHMHWIDMEWMWGLGTLENSVIEMLRLVEKNNLKGAINFDAIGYEYLAWKHPETFQRLKKAIEEGKIEIAAGTYTQPYPIFIGEESNIQQIIFGVRTCERLFGVRPKLFWEEEFYFFPQLPQIMLQAGYEVYCFFFQETWHTPYVPKFQQPTVLWQGRDGSKIAAITFTDLCVHQWPEDLEKSIKDSLESDSQPILIQWLELLNSPKWMCRAELIESELNKLQDFFEFEPVKPSDVITFRKPEKTVSFKLADLYHGLSIGKNGNTLQIERRKVEHSLLDAQALATIAYLNGLSPQWLDYPSWEFEEAQRLLMISQAHDIDECEGFCGDVGKIYLRTALEFIESVLKRYMKTFSKIMNSKYEICVFNPLPWERKGYAKLQETNEIAAINEIPALSICAVNKSNQPEIHVQIREENIEVFWRGTRYEILPTAVIRTKLESNIYELNKLCCAGYEPQIIDPAIFRRLLPDLVEICLRTRIGPYLCDQRIKFGELNSWIEVEAEIQLLEKPKPGYVGALMVELHTGEELRNVRYDYPFGVEEALPSIEHYRYYPKGSWMTSEKFFEKIKNHFASLRFVQLLSDHTNLLFLHVGNHGFIRDGSKVYCVLYLYDPWDEENFARKVKTRYGFSFDDQKDPLKLAQEFNRPMIAETIVGEQQGTNCFQPFKIFGNIQMSALYVQDNSIIVRLWNPKEENQKIEILPNFPYTKVKKTNLLGEEIEELEKELILKPFEIVTLKYELPIRIEQNLDDFRYVWSKYQKKRWIDSENFPHEK